ncbi:MAG: excisionase [Deltaproteobacteria bacterium]|nr:excisionase [Deltaproteobacteria bacterium]
MDKLGISTPLPLLAKCFGLSLSDQYWICPDGSGLRWEDVNFFDHPFSADMGDILFGDAPGKPALDLRSPDNTSDGWLKKKWTIVDGRRLLVKAGSGFWQEPFNEVLASAVMRRLGIRHVNYDLAMIEGRPYSVCEDFIDAGTDFVPAFRIALTRRKPNHVSPYRHFLDCCGDLGIPGVQDELDRMLTVDYVIVNEDRHYNNFGAIRNADTLEWLGPAPVFDSGTSMWHDSPATLIQPSEPQPSKPFKTHHSEQIKLVRSFEWLDSAALAGIDGEFMEIIGNSDFIDAARRNALCQGLHRRVKMLEEHVQNRTRASVSKPADILGHRHRPR